jgi:hypothetical protein
MPFWETANAWFAMTGDMGSMSQVYGTTFFDLLRSFFPRG